MEGLGRIFNVLAAGDGLWVNMRDCDAVTFIGYLGGAAGDTYTLQQATSAAGAGATNLACITQYYTNRGDGTDAWVKRTQAAAATVVAAATAAQQAVVFGVNGAQLADGFSYVKVTSTGAGTVTALQHDLDVMRTPPNLAAVSA